MELDYLMIYIYFAACVHSHNPTQPRVLLTCSHIIEESFAEDTFGTLVGLYMP